MQSLVEVRDRTDAIARNAVHSEIGHRIRSVSVIGGFLDAARFEFVEGLNCFIGARGAGKTTVVELIRFALDVPPSREASAMELRRIEALVDRNLAGGRVQVTIETKDGLCYVITRTAGEEPLVLTADGKPTDLTLKSGGLFRADIYSQNEVEGIADRKTSQLDLIDNFEAERIAEIDTQIDQVRSVLATNANEIVPLQTRIYALGEELGTLAGIDEKLKHFSGAGGENAKTINQAHALKSLRDRERRTVSESRQMLQSFSQDLAALNGRLAQQTSVLGDRDVVKGPNGELVANVLEELKECGRVVDDMLGDAGKGISATLGRIATASIRLDAIHKEQELEFRSLIEKHRHAQGQAAERTQLERRRNDLLAKERLRHQLREQLSTLQGSRTKLLQRLSELWDERFAIRESVAERINTALSPTIRVSVQQFGNPELYRQLLEEALKSARIKHLIVAQKIAGKFWPVALATAIRERKTAALIDRAELNPEQAEKALVALYNPKLLFELETVELLDLPRIELKDGDTYKDSLSLSTGQKCTAILPILLLDSANPLLIDQPEDNLDNRFIFETVVDSIHKVKTGRQLIFVTHNPNIPVLGDAERVFVLDSDGSAARMANEGTVDECKSEIVTLLEGGEDAFKARKYRYAY
jgi:DNA repair ATPase RecN